MGVAGYVLSGGNYIGDFPSAGFHWLKSIKLIHRNISMISRPIEKFRLLASYQVRDKS